MKKLSLLIALCMLISIGGVYATWEYAAGSIQNEHYHLTMSLTGAETSEAEGKFVMVLNDLQIILDDVPDADGLKDWHGDAIYSGAMHYVFKPGTGADPDIQDGISVKVEMLHNNPLVYTPQTGSAASSGDIFSINSNPVVIPQGDLVLITEGNCDTLTSVSLRSHIGDYYFKITGEEVMTNINVNLYLPTLADYNHFHEWFRNAAKGQVLGVQVSMHSEN